MNAGLKEIWLAWRALCRRPGYLLLASGVLALGVGASLAVYVLIEAVLLRPLPYPQASRLVQLGRERSGVAYTTSPVIYQHMLPLQGVQSVGLIRFRAEDANIAVDDVPQLLPAVHADRGYLATLGVALTLGRNFSADEDRPNGPKVVLLSHGFWLRRYGGDASVLGRNMSIEGVSHQIIGVLPAGVDIKQADLLLPMALPADSEDEGRNFYVIARLAPDVTAAAVGAEFAAKVHAMYLRIGGAGASFAAHEAFRADDLQTAMRVRARPVLMMFLASASMVLLIVLVNLANLMLLRSMARSHDAAVRDALGAPWLRRLLPLLAEGLLIAIAGTVAGMLLAWLGLQALRGLIPAEWLAGSSLQVQASAYVLALVLALTLVSLSVALGLWWGLKNASPDELRAGGRGGTGRRGGLLGRVLVTAQVALASTLLCAAGVFLHALYDAARVPLGFSSDGILTFELAPVRGTYSDNAAIQRLAQQLLDRLRMQPGVVRATAGTGLPAGDLSQNFYLGSIHAPGQDVPDTATPQVRAVDPDFFSVFQIPAHQGRSFQSSDRRGGEAVAIVNQRLADQMYGGDAVGKMIEMGAIPSLAPHSARIVGVIDTISPFGPLGDTDGILYLPLAQMPDDLMQIVRTVNPLRFALAVHGNPDDYRRMVGRVVAEVAPSQPVSQLLSMRSVVRETTAGTRLDLLLIGLFAGLALLLAAVGMYAVMSVAVAIREREFGVRMALGASPARLIAGILRAGLLQVVIGLLAGFALAFILAGLLRAVLLQINRQVFDLPVLAAVCLTLALSGLLACLLPAWRASRVEPTRALRGE
ncbi:ABC transporter permease [Dyella acidiphila]|uniref:ABC transporter permease n=1 Tax=Dyella acidiphila TaxID=2775866 RepID=A0ABR9GBA9_9GAMM|nr:ABC transporter permease [Dyella acidiphila]MBE1161337.1 ABC transporter permease [Dyella acidiphila]